jgi:hypothetical protein
MQTLLEMIRDGNTEAARAWAMSRLENANDQMDQLDPESPEWQTLAGYAAGIAETAEALELF